ncbi:protein-L-isoaspartate(D-aspartate) O-methyltransferase [Ralstonia sp. CHL-2022]|uniref:Protein-L-isoaspartate O-methyltransferase n=1 Tax=Ralstonia mojiangensis TaxID=2953895 RepID=A0AAE3LCM6_9RALS|nr:protein-L-isoaspartate(D-aspartate) O-methyltransferase [Ralstonia mojiangensis]MCT7316667.1 protein-L-isoaspartate(D-aspartate) O-methyltransferase [Ralstonia mojiangensis]MCT7328116.1 protein-L-isoaspartate(D-aspartate) O-methyltransferase [Ralstonia mojiangensis]
MSERPRDRRFPLTLDAVVERKPVERQRETRISSGVSAVSRPTPVRAASVERASPASAPAPAPQRVAGVDAVVGAVAASAVQARTAAAHAAAGGMASDRARQALVGRVQAGGVIDKRVLAAIGTVPRHLFVDAGLASQAYEDSALPIGHQQTISKPSVVGRMIELLLSGRSGSTGMPLARVLEIGTGCGYQAAVLAQLADEVYSIERVRPLHEKAKANLRPLRVPNIRLHYGDGMLGLPKAAPFDAIILAAAGPEVPQALLDQLAVGGRLIAPVATDRNSGPAQQLVLIERRSRFQFHSTALEGVFFVPLKSGTV